MVDGRYIYCIVGEPFKEQYGTSAINGLESEVRTVRFRDIGAVVSSLPPDVHKVSTTRKNMLAHQRVMEEVMKGTPILPVKFGTVAEPSGDGDTEDRIRSRVLEERYQELADLLAEMRGKVELGLKVLWVDIKTIYREIVAENPRIARLRSKVNRTPESGSYQSKVTLGENVKNALDGKRAGEAGAMMKALKAACVEYRENNIFGDRMVMNGAFLVQSELADEFDAIVERLKEENDGRVLFRYLGPVPPSNFVELTITWE
ncbi:MAG: GvpL/GvpF family gas vesicle protein [Actinobacteria bacterium]|nr:GvpL/GvpF family gas vesicle protein [Actinomycetota bacterium]MBU4179054.1 GvpL/GvpF family gas vesicle protein [Actinomycetota bacterium]MBU4403768.1 GvpL/GvpF family gas vesicle protein [Actinomycetota bacterium]MCG2819305.1 GvpL/GvpF family gas vesicle protein [Actinomycetes bacterium]